MTLKYTNQEHTLAAFNGTHFSLAAPGDWDSIGDGPTREAVKAWIAEGNEPEPYTPPTPLVPSSVSRAQGKMALVQAGYWPAVVAFVDGIEDPNVKAMAEIALNDTTEWRRDSAFLQQCAAAIGMVDADLDKLFFIAAAIEL